MAPPKVRVKTGGDFCSAPNCQNARYKIACKGWSFFRFPRDQARGLLEAIPALAPWVLLLQLPLLMPTFPNVPGFSGTGPWPAQVQALPVSDDQQIASDGSGCRMCLITYDHYSCQRCWVSSSGSIPFLAKRAGASPAEEEAELVKAGTWDDRVEEMEEEDPGHGQVSSQLEVWAELAPPRDSVRKRGFARVDRNSGCNCCYMSRFSNVHCCQICSLASKRTHKRSPAGLAAAQPLVLDPESELDRESSPLILQLAREARVQAADYNFDDCSCCLMNAAVFREDRRVQACCDRCVNK